MSFNFDFKNKRRTLTGLIQLGCFVVTMLQVTSADAQDKKPYLDIKLPVEERINDLVGRLSLDQKIKLLQYRGVPVSTNGLEIPGYNWWNECLHGVARAGKATVFPQAIALASTWDTAMIGQVATAISDEARAKYNYFSARDKRGIYQGLNFWTPNINIFRDPRWGRGMETYGEDPYLTGKIASSFIKGLQGNDPDYLKTIATVKHFAVHSGPEQQRHRFNANVSDRDFYETYTPAFKMAVQEAGVYSLMCAYNRFRDKPCCGSDFLLTDLLRNQWGFKGFIVTDCGAVDDFFRKDAHEVVRSPEEAAVMAIRAGVDLECGDVFNALDIAIQKKLITEKELDVAIKRLFTARFKLGFFDPPSTVKYNKIPYDVVSSDAHRELALQTARKSIVLLKNSANTLPLNKNIRTLAVIGPNADDSEVMLANYNGYPTHVVTPLEGIRQKLKGTRVLYARGSAHVQGLPATDQIPAACLFKDPQGKKQGLQADYYSNAKMTGSPQFSRTDTAVNFNFMEHAPASGMDDENFSAKWTGYLKAPVSGKTVIDINGSSEYEMLVDGKSIIKFSSEYSPGHTYTEIEMVKDKLYPIEIRYANQGANGQISLTWELPGTDFRKEALRVANQSDAVVMCMGLSPRIEGEEMKIKLDGFDGGDRTSMKLPDVQESLIKEIVALGKPVVLVLVNGSALSINWENKNVPAILETWYGGQEGGRAIADVLFGDYNPGAKLPITFYASDKDLPGFEDYSMAGRTYRYFKGKPLFPFGYGLSYTSFRYAGLKAVPVIKAGQTISVTASVTNVGAYDGEEVVQLYISHQGASVPVPIRSMRSFRRIYLKKGEKKLVSFDLRPADFSEINKDGKIQVEAGNYDLFVGGGQPTEINTLAKQNNVIRKTVRLTGRPVLIK